MLSEEQSNLSKCGEEYFAMQYHVERSERMDFFCQGEQML